MPLPETAAGVAPRRGANQSTKKLRAHSDTALPEKAPKTRAQLTLLSGANVGLSYPLVARETLLGRGDDVHVRTEDEATSRHHARILALRGGRYILEDLKSTNGTYLGGRKVTRVELTSGDRVRLGPRFTVSFAVLDSLAGTLTQQLYDSSMRDPLTGVFNRRFLSERLASEIAYARRHTTHLGVVLFDLDHFKRINDAQGHAAGDDVLRSVAGLVSRIIRAEDVLARYGGEEFVVLARGIDHANVGRLAERLRSGVEGVAVGATAAALKVTVSAGFASLAELPTESRSGEALLKLADERLYRAKILGRNAVCGA